MELCFENKTVSGYRELIRMTRSVPVSVETVVPDTNDDVGDIASVQTNVFLKSKEINGNTVTVTGEAAASVMYITENRMKLDTIRVTRQFSIEYELPEGNPEAAQIKLAVSNVQTRALNPRKISVQFEISGTMSAYDTDSFPVESLMPDEKTCQGVHIRREELRFSAVTAVAEKAFAVSEQFAFSSDKPKPVSLMSEKSEFEVTDVQMIGSKAVIKGQLCVRVIYASDEVSYPIEAQFVTPFSQIADTGGETVDYCASSIELTSAYYSIQDAINGEKTLNAELHALIQLSCGSRKTGGYIADAYSNLLPAHCIIRNRVYSDISETKQVKYIADETLSTAEDCDEILSILPSALRTSGSGEKLTATAGLDVIYRNARGELMSVKRLLNFEGGIPASNYVLISEKLTDVYFRADGQNIGVHAAAELSYRSVERRDVSRVISVELDEEHPYDFDEFPSLVLVRAEGNELWNYARTYHSSLEEIAEYNDLDSLTPGKLLMIPKSI